MIHTKLTDTGDGGLIIQHQQDVTAILEDNKRLFKEDAGYNQDRNMKRAASIPLGVYLAWKQDYGIDALDQNHWPAVRRLLNSSEWAHLRTAAGRL